MSLSYEMSLENYEDFYITVRDELKSNNIFGVVTEVNILDQFLEENMISEEFHKKNLQRCIKIDNDNLNKELFTSMFISSLAAAFNVESEANSKIIQKDELIRSAEAYLK